jgi:hypothetical protein
MVLAAFADGAVQMVSADGQRHTPFRFGGGRATPPQVIGPIDIRSRDGFVAAAVRLEYSEAPAFEDEVVLLDSSGRVRWHATVPMRGDDVMHLYLGRQGRLLRDFASRGTELIAEDGSVQRLGPYPPLAPPGDDGWFPLGIELPRVQGGQQEGIRFDWVSPDGSARVPGALPVESGAWWAHDRLVYVTHTGPGAVVVSERPGDVRELPAPDLNFYGQVSDHWAILGDLKTSWARFDAEAVTVEPIALPPNQASRWPQVNERGDILLELEGDSGARFFASPDLGKTFEPIGHAIPLGADHFNLQLVGPVVGGTYLVRSYSQLFVPQLPSVTQIVRPGDGLERDLSDQPEWPLVLSEDGLCLVLAPPGENAPQRPLRVLNVKSGQLTDLGIDPGYYIFPVWIE